MVINSIFSYQMWICLLQKYEEKMSQNFSEMEEYALSSLQLVTMEASVKMSSDNEVELKATMNDIALIDLQKERQGRKTG